MRKLNFNLRPPPALKSPGGQAESGKLIAYDSQPDAYKPKPAHIAEKVRKDRADDGDAQGGGNGGKQYVTGSPQASHINNLGNLQKDNDG